MIIKTLIYILFIFNIHNSIASEAPKINDTINPSDGIFIGNSYLYYNNSLHNHFRKLTQSLEPEREKAFFFKSMTISGSDLADHAMGAEGMISAYKHKKKKGEWDFVVLQGQSREPIDKKKATTANGNIPTNPFVSDKTHTTHR